MWGFPELYPLSDGNGKDRWLLLIILEQEKKIIFVSMSDVSAIYGYIGVLKLMPEGDFDAYKEQVKTAEIAFRSALTQVALEMQDEKRLILFYRDFKDLGETLKSFHPTTNREKGWVDWVAYQATKADEAADYIKRVQADLSDEPQVSETPATKKEQLSKFEKKMQDYGELLSVKDLTEIFNCTPRTIANWEDRGLIVNVAETSEEVNALGRRKRGQEKRYRKDTILRSLVLRERFESQV